MNAHWENETTFKKTNKTIFQQQQQQQQQTNKQ
jgi:hypothetical protein